MANEQNTTELEEENIAHDDSAQNLTKDPSSDSIQSENSSDGEPDEILIPTEENENTSSDNDTSDQSEETSQESDPNESSDTEERAENSEEYLLQLQRLQAEFDNFRKRQEREKLLLKEMITENNVVELLPIIDNFERALATTNLESSNLKSFVDGMEMVFKQFENVFENFNVKRMACEGEKFDPLCHEAVSKAPSNEVEKDRVLQVLQNGWMLGEKVIRPAMVVVSEGPEEKTLEDETIKQDEEN